MADSLSDVLITLGVIALVVLVIWLFETGKIKFNQRFGRILIKIGVGIFVVVGIAYLVIMAGFMKKLCIGRHGCLATYFPLRLMMRQLG